MKETVNSGRLDYFDIAKGLAMFCVIAGHMGMAQTFNPFAFSFHMPLFFLISGYFYKNDAAKVLRNTKRLLTAYLWTVLAVIILSEVMPLAKVALRGDDVISLAKVAGHWALAGLYGSGARGDCLGMHLPAIGAVWFLLALAWGVHPAHYQQITKKFPPTCRLLAGVPRGMALGKMDVAASFHPVGNVRHALLVRRL